MLFSKFCGFLGSKNGCLWKSITPIYTLFCPVESIGKTSMGYKTWFEQIKTVWAWNSLNTNKQRKNWLIMKIIYKYCLLYQQVDYWRHWSTPYWYQAVVESAYRVILSPWLVLKLRKLKFLDCVEDCRVNCEQFKCSSRSLCGDLRPIYSMKKWLRHQDCPVIHQWRDMVVVFNIIILL